MAKDKENTNEKAPFQSGHRQSNSFGKMDKEVTPDGDGALNTNSSKTEGKEDVQKTVDTILKDNDSDKE